MPCHTQHTRGCAAAVGCCVPSDTRTVTWCTAGRSLCSLTRAVQTVTGALPAAGQEDPAPGDRSIRFVAVAGGAGSAAGGAGAACGGVCGTRQDPPWCAGCRGQAVPPAVVPQATVRTV